MYYKSFCDSGCIYSLDMVRLSFDVGSRDKELVNYFMHLDTYDDTVEIKYFHSLKNFTFRHLWNVFLSPDVSFSVALDFLAGSDNHSKGWIEFNPNKCENFTHFQDIKGYIFSCCFSRELVRYDLAIDLPFPRSSCKLIRENRKLYSYLIKDNGVTEYLGRKKKAYNAIKELKSNGKYPRAPVKQRESQ